MPKTASPRSALARFPDTQLVRTYVWEKPVRVAHWLIFFAFLALSVTGFYLHRPFISVSNPSSFLMAKVRFAHELAGFVLIAAFILRIYWFFKGNFWSRWFGYLPIHRTQWRGIGSMLEFYLFMRFTPGHRSGHNPLAALTYLIVYLLFLFEILIGLALYDRVLHNAIFHQFIGWLPHLIALQYLREIHYFLMWVFFAFVIFHVYASVLVSLEEENGLLDSIFSGWKFVAAGELRHEIAAIPEVRGFVRRHQLLPRGTPQEERTGQIPRPRPGPGPVKLYRNWTSYIGTGIAAVGLLVFAVLTAYHTVGGGAIAQPYGDLVIFFVPPIFIVVGVILVLVGMYLEWIRWRARKPLSFARYPKWDLNLDAERKALLAVAIGALVLGGTAVYESYNAYLSTDSVAFCGATCHSMRPEYATYQLSPHAHVVCAQCHVGPGASGYLASKLRGVAELVETIKDDYPRPIPVPLTALRPIRGNCERCHWPAAFLGSHEVQYAHFLSDERNTRWDLSMLVRIGGGPLANTEQMGIHWHVASKVEYVATDETRQNLPWVRAVNPLTGIVTVYTSQPQKNTASPPGEIRTMDCVDCHDRPSHILQSPDRSVDVGLSEGSIDPSLPYAKRQCVAALAAGYATREQAMSGIADALRGYYQKTYPQVYLDKQASITAAIDYLRRTYNDYFFPSMKVRWDTYPMNNGHFHFLGCSRCHDDQHKSVDGKVIPSGCDTCHQILQQGKAGSTQFATGPQGLSFVHPVDIGGVWAQVPCSSCHTGGPM